MMYKLMNLVAAAVAGFSLAVVAMVFKAVLDDVVQESQRNHDEGLINEWMRAGEEYELIVCTPEGAVYKKTRTFYSPAIRHWTTRS